MRKRDRPGSYRILDRGGTFVLSGVKLNGARVKQADLSRADAEKLAEILFPPSIGAIPISMPQDFRTPDAPKPIALDDFGLPPISAEATAALNASMGNGLPLPVGHPPNLTTATDAEKKARQAKSAKSLMELTGIGIAAGSVYMGRRWCEAAEKEAPKPNPKQVNDCADAIRDAFSELFGDREIKPWQLAMMLAIGIPVSMYLQATPKKKLTGNPSVTEEPNHLRSVT